MKENTDREPNHFIQQKVLLKLTRCPHTMSAYVTLNYQSSFFFFFKVCWVKNNYGEFYYIPRSKRNQEFILYLQNLFTEIQVSTKGHSQKPLLKEENETKWGKRLSSIALSTLASSGMELLCFQTKTELLDVCLDLCILHRRPPLHPYFLSYHFKPSHFQVQAHQLFSL